MTEEGFCLFSYPAALDMPKWLQDDIDGAVIDDLYHYEPF